MNFYDLFCAIFDRIENWSDFVEYEFERIPRGAAWVDWKGFPFHLTKYLWNCKCSSRLARPRKLLFYLKSDCTSFISPSLISPQLSALKFSNQNDSSWINKLNGFNITKYFQLIYD